MTIVKRSIGTSDIVTADFSPLTLNQNKKVP